MGGGVRRQGLHLLAASALAIGVLLVPFLVRVDRPYVTLCLATLLIEAAVGLLGFYYHAAANLAGPAPGRFDNFVYGTSVLAPLLFPNLALLAALGLWPLRRHLPAADINPSVAGSCVLHRKESAIG